MKAQLNAPSPNTLRGAALHIIRLCNPQEKAAALRKLESERLINLPHEAVAALPGIPGRPERLELVHATQMKHRAVGTLEGRAMLIHALAHIEANAVNLALDILWRFGGMPERFYLDWWQVAQEEALHFQLLDAHLNSLGFAYGDFAAHDGLWDMAEKTKDSLLARLALVPRTLEARGLDASPAVRNKLISVGDRAGADILSLILRDEIGHVAVGNRWYRHLCAQQGLDHVQTYADLAKRYGAPQLKGPFNLDARRAAGFDEVELAQLGS